MVENHRSTPGLTGLSIACHGGRFCYTAFVVQIVNWQILLIVLCLGSLTLAQEPKTSPATGYIEKFEVPERDKLGNLKWKMMGDKAQLHENGSILVFNMRAEFYSSNVVQLVFTSPVCLVDRQTNTGRTDAPVRLEHDNIVVTGTGADWAAATSSFVIHSNVQVVITGSATNAALIGATP